MRDDVLTLYKRAIKEAKIRGHHVPMDFANWYIIGILEGKREHQRIGDAFKDYLRQETKWNKIDKTAPKFVQYIEELDSRFTVMELKEQLRFEKEVWLDSRGMLVVILYFFHEWELQQIGEFFGVGASRMSQILKQTLASIRDQLR